MSIELTRREFFITAAAAALVVSLPSSTKYEVNNVDWEDVLNRVIENRNAFMSGAIKAHRRYEKWSPEWCMEEALAEWGYLSEGAVVHV